MRAVPQVTFSYAMSDRAAAQSITALLQAEGYDTFWDKDVAAFSAAAEAAARSARCVIVICSYASASSKWVLDEAERAFSRKALVQVDLERVGPLFDAPYTDLSDWDGSTRAPQWRQMMEQIRAVCGRPAGDLPVKEYRWPVAANAVVGLGGAIGLMFGLGPQAPKPDEFAAIEPETTLTREEAFAIGGPMATRLPPAAAAELPEFAALPMAFAAAPIEVVYENGLEAPLEAPELALVEGPSMEMRLAYTLEFMSDARPIWVARQR